MRRPRVSLICQRRKFFGLLGISAALIVASGNVRGGPAAGLPGVKVITSRVGNATVFSLHNSQLAELTVSLNFTLANMLPSVPLPLEFVVPPKCTTAPLLTLYPADPSRPSHYNWRESHTWGSPRVHPVPAVVYRLPFESGRSFKVIQGHYSAFSHTGESSLAVDFSMPEGTPVLAAREGMVVLKRDGFDAGCDSPDYKYRANLVFVRHNDGTIAEYLHLLKGGIQVKEGGKVVAGQVLALSGNSGYTRGPHLHFMVFRAKDSKTRQSLPIRFLTANGPVSIEEGQSYTAVDDGLEHDRTVGHPTRATWATRSVGQPDGSGPRQLGYSTRCSGGAEPNDEAGGEDGRASGNVKSH